MNKKVKILKLSKKELRAFRGGRSSGGINWWFTMASARQIQQYNQDGIIPVGPLKGKKGRLGKDGKPPVGLTSDTLDTAPAPKRR